MRKLFAILTILSWLWKSAPAQLSTCSPAPMHLIKSTTLTYRRLGANLYDNRYRFNYTYTVECGNTHSANPLYIYAPEKPAKTYAIVPWLLDSSKNIIGVPDPCLDFTAPPCYSVFYYHVDTLLPLNQFGYTASVLACCSPAYTNISVDSTELFHYQDPAMTGFYVDSCTPDAGKDFTANGMAALVRIRPISTAADLNSSPQFIGQDTILFVAKDSLFSNQVYAIDPDGDSLAYHFSTPYSFNLVWNCYGACIYTMIPKPPLPQLLFAPGYSVTQPAGPGFTLDPNTGWLKGSIHDTGTYIVPVSVMEYRKGLLLDSVTKDVTIRVFDATLLPKPKAVLPVLINDCHDFTITFPNGSTPDYHGYNWLRTFNWRFGDGDTSTAVYPVHTYSDTGAYKVRMILFPGLYCADTAYSTVLVYPKVQAAFSHNDSCSGQLVDFINNSVSTSGPITGTSWAISLNDKTIDSATTNNLTYTFQKAPQSYSVILRIVNSEGCATADTQTVNIYHSPYPLAFHDTILTKGTPITLHANDGNYGLNATYYWTPPTGLSDPSSADPVLNSQTEGTWSVTITNAFGCQLTDSVHVKYYTGPDIYLPNAFTPNGDGRNDWLRPLIVGIASSFEFRVFNRGGQLLFQTNRSGEGWDGKIGQRPALPGTYVWEASGIDYKGKLIVRKGTVELVR